MKTAAFIILVALSVYASHLADRAATEIIATMQP